MPRGIRMRKSASPSSAARWRRTAAWATGVAKTSIKSTFLPPGAPACSPVRIVSTNLPNDVFWIRIGFPEVKLVHLHEKLRLRIQKSPTQVIEPRAARRLSRSDWDNDNNNDNNDNNHDNDNNDNDDGNSNDQNYNDDNENNDDDDDDDDVDADVDVDVDADVDAELDFDVDDNLDFAVDAQKCLCT